mgnify:CR=1 FL=1
MTSASTSWSAASMTRLPWCGKTAGPRSCANASSEAAGYAMYTAARIVVVGFIAQPTI